MELRKIDADNLWKIVHLSVKENQKGFVATNTESILEAYVTITNGGTALPFGMYHDDMLIGFVMIGFHSIDEHDPAIANGNYCLWRFMIDASYQGKGLGKQAMQAVLDYIRSFPCGSAAYCWLSYEAENVAAKALYHAFGFKENGEICEGEIVAVRSL